MENLTDPAHKRVYWHSRRGMLELDLVLMPFASKVYPTLAQEKQALYCRLLESEDTDLYAWFLRHRQPEDAELAEMVEAILLNAKQCG